MGGKSSGSSAPPPPDYTKQADLDLRNQQTMLEAQTKANRTNSVGPQGSNTWSQDANGNWTNTTDAGDAGKNYQAQQAALLRQTQAGAAALPGATDKALTSLDTSQLPDWQKFNMDPTGNSKAIQDATYGLLAPQRQMARDGEIQRLKNQGLSEDSPAFQRAMLTLGQGDTDAQLKSLLAGQQEYGNAFSRAQTNATMSNALRGTMLGEQSNLNNYDLNQANKVMGLTAGGAGGNGLPQIGNGNVPQQGVADASGGMAALNNTYKAQMDAYNANQAKSASNGKGVGSLLGAGVGGFFGGLPGASLGGNLGGLLGGIF
jgi:hypothetical protein